MRKESKKAKKNGLQKRSNALSTRIPNLYPEKEKMIQEQDLINNIEQKLKKLKRTQEEDLEELIIEDSDRHIINEIERDIQEFKFKEKSKQQYKRELNTLIDKSNVILYVLDCRDPFAYRSKELEANCNKHSKKIIFLLNKADLCQDNYVQYFVKKLRKDHPTIAFSTKFNQSNFVTDLTNLISQLDIVNKYISVIGYPNVGKQSIINTLKQQFRIYRKSIILDNTKEVKFY